MVAPVLKSFQAEVRPKAQDMLEKHTLLLVPSHLELAEAASASESSGESCPALLQTLPSPKCPG